MDSPVTQNSISDLNRQFSLALQRFFPDLHHGPHRKVVRRSLSMWDRDLCPRVLLLPCCSRELCAHLCLLSHLCDGVTQNQFCKTGIKIIFFSFIKIKRQQLHKYLEQETSGTSGWRYQQQPRSPSWPAAELPPPVFKDASPATLLLCISFSLLFFLFVGKKNLLIRHSQHLSVTPIKRFFSIYFFWLNEYLFT